MKYSFAAVVAAASGALAFPSNGTVIVTEVVESYVTYCPSPTTITHGSSTWTVTEPTTITITDCPCTITKPVITTSSVICHTCTPEVPEVPEEPITDVPGVPEEPIVTDTPDVPEVPVVPTGGITLTNPILPTGTTPVPVPTAGAAKLGLSGVAGLAVIAALL